MSFPVHAAITYRAAAKLLISGELDPSCSWPDQTAEYILDALLAFSVDELLQIVDAHTYGNIADVKFIPQFGKLDTIQKVPTYFTGTGSRSTDYARLGFFLKSDPYATLSANTKFGENHGKAAALLGIADLNEYRIVPSAFTYAFLDYSLDNQADLLRRLLFRVPIVQILLHSANSGCVDGYRPMAQLKESTQRRRGNSVRNMLKALESFDHAELNRRLCNITWNDYKGDIYAEI